jgi:hypothetical protein
MEEVRVRKEEHKTLLVFPSLKSLYYYWLVIFYFNIVHSLWTNKKSGFRFWHVHIIQLLVFCCKLRCGITLGYIEYIEGVIRI